MVRQFEAADSLGRAFDYYAQAGDVNQSVAITEYLSYYIIIGGERNRLAQIFDGALTLVSSGSHEAGRILSSYGFFFGYTRR